MDERAKQADDTVRQHELLHNERTIEHPTLGAVKLSRPTPQQEFEIADERRKRYHADMQDESILSRAQLEAIAIKRGIWTPEQSKRIQELSIQTGQAMGILNAVGFKSPDELIKDYNLSVEKLVSLFDDEEVLEVVRRYMDISQEPDSKDYIFISKNATSSEVDDLLESLDSMRGQIKMLLDMRDIRDELMRLQGNETQLFVDSVEQRAQRAEELARIFYCAVNAKNGKRLWKNIDDMRKAQPGEIEFLIMEMYYFVHGVTEEYRETLSKYGFIQRLTTTKDSSDDSPAQPQSSPVGESVGSEPTSFSEAMA